MQILIPLGFSLTIFLLLHFVIGKYPPPLSAAKNPKREVLESLGLWLLVVIAVTAAILVIPESELKDPSPQIVLRTNLVLFPIWVLIPLIFVRRWNQWRLKDAGFQAPQSRSVLVFAVFVYGAIGVLQFVDPDFAQLPAWLVVMSLYQPAFTEEFFFRGVIQGKLERAIGQNKAWFYSGILFGLMHASVNFFGQQWFRHGESIVSALTLLLLQTIAGWVFGIMYMKSRSLLPNFIAHYFADGRLASILSYISAAVS